MRWQGAPGTLVVLALLPWYVLGSNWPQGLGCPTGTCCPPQKSDGSEQIWGFQTLPQGCQ